MNVPFWTQGRTADLANLRPADMTVEVIGATLARINRFGGRTPEPFSVAAHSVLVECLCPPDLRPWAILHDAHEAFIGDIMVPAADLFDLHTGADDPFGGRAVSVAIARAKGAIDRAIGSAWGVAVRSMNAALRQADRTALIAEAWEFLGRTPPPMAPDAADLLDDAVRMLRRLPVGGDWRAARDLWTARVEHYASLGRMTPPRATGPAGMVTAGNPEGEMEW